jgi:sulfonate transport system substrate-binding protein
MKKILRVQLLSLLLLGVMGINLAHGAEPAHGAEKKPSVIRFGIPGASYGKPFTSGVGGIVHAKGLLEEEFRKDGIKVEWSLFKGAGPAVNESFANDLLDFALLGDVAFIINKSGGLKTRLIAGGAPAGNSYIAVPSDSSITSVAQLKGKKVAIFKGTVYSLVFARIVARYGLTEKDFKVYNLDPASAAAALKSKDIDAGLFGSDVFTLTTQGVGKIIDSTRDDKTSKFASGVLVTEKFAAEYPDIAKRVVKVWLQAAKWGSGNRDAAFQVWTKSGIPLSAFKQDYGTTPGKQILSPIFDEFYVTHLKDAVKASKEKGIIRKPFDVDQFIDSRYLDAALKELKLENYWDKYDASGRKK